MTTSLRSPSSFRSRLGSVGKDPSARVDLGREAVALQPLRPTDHELPILADKVGASRSRPEIDEALLLLLGHQHPIKPGEPLGVYLAPELLGDFDLALMAQLERHQLARPMADAMRDVVAGHVENLPVVGDAAQDDVGMEMARVVVIDRDPVEPGIQVGFHLPHEVAGEAAQVAQLGGVLWRHDEAELVPVLSATLDEGAAVRLVLQ